ncbi:hypothetical protein Amet_4173 [Alkaliphilus metalliredigens QYMF]|uniref:MacB-like periplasmic core domain-containing protein n=1 Tax=Alkaliphilus metalliredigens (strain QYMF) TaxID=293826 RepID=A6TVN6_ALKMQ|nr:hypothetical protein [Alkaliphilus metalliredigens]ABR50254.1 hypothetical protein Amet_4173 [Alkaliphilus metalliredigens QYMF]
MLKYILKEDIKRNLIQFVLMICLFTMVFSLFNYLIFTKILLSDNQTRYAQNVPKDYISIAYNQEYSPFYSQPNGERNVKTMYEKLVNAKEFEYYEIYYQSLYILNYEGSDIFRKMYEDGNPYKEDIVMEMNGTKYPPAATIKAAQLSYNCFSDFNLKLLEGQKFKEEDYFHSINETVPIILGYEYKKQYKLGQELQGVYIAEPFNFEVIGFLEQDSYIQIGNDIQYLDRYIIMPCINCEKPINTQDKIFQVRHYGLKTSGILKPIEGVSNNKAKTIINKMAKESGLKKYSSWSTNDIAGIDQREVGSSLISSFIVFYGILVFISSALIIIIFNKKILRNIGTYWAYLVSGANILTIKRSIQFEILIVLAVSNILSVIIQLLIFKPSLLYSVINIVVSLIIWFVTANMIGSDFLNKLFLKNAWEE